MSTIEPGKRARDLLADAEEAYRKGAWLVVSAASDLARAYYAAAQLDLFERQYADAVEADKERADDFARFLSEQEAGSAAS